MKELAKESFNVCLLRRQDIADANDSFRLSVKKLGEGIRECLQKEMRIFIFYEHEMQSEFDYKYRYEKFGLQVSMYVCLPGGDWHMATHYKIKSNYTETDKHFIACAQSIVDKLNGKE